MQLPLFREKQRAFTELPSSDEANDWHIGEIEEACELNEYAELDICMLTHCEANDIADVVESPVPRVCGRQLLSRSNIQNEISQRRLKPEVRSDYGFLILHTIAYAFRAKSKQ